MARDASGLFAARAAPGDAPVATTTPSVCPSSARAPIRCRAGSPRASTAPRALSTRPRFDGTTPAGAASRAATSSSTSCTSGPFRPKGPSPGWPPGSPYLRDLGITAIELMPVAAFPGPRNWGYDGVYLYAPHDAYGGPEALKRLVDACHAHGLALVPRRRLQPLRSRGELPGRLRALLHRPLPHAVGRRDQLRRSPTATRCAASSSTTPRYWLAEYHVDGLRLDAIQGIYDSSARPILQRWPTPFTPRRRGWRRPAWLIAESDLNDPRVIRPSTVGGLGHGRAVERRLSSRAARAADRRRRGYFGDFGRVADLAKAITEGFVYDGQHAPHRRRRHGASSVADAGRSLRHVHPESRSGRQRVSGAPARRTSPGSARQRVAAAILFASPCCRCCSRARSTGRRRRSTTSPATAIPPGRGGAPRPPRGVPAPAATKARPPRVGRSTGRGDVPAHASCAGPSPSSRTRGCWRSTARSSRCAGVSRPCTTAGRI